MRMGSRLSRRALAALVSMARTASTANFVKVYGWPRGVGTQPGAPNDAATQAWNAAGVYEQSIALIGREIDGGGGAAE